MSTLSSLDDSAVEKVLTNPKVDLITTNTNKSIGVGQIIIAEVSTADSKRVLHRIDYCIIPLMGFCYMLQYMDKLALSQGTLLGLRTGLVCVAPFSCRLQGHITDGLLSSTSKAPNTHGAPLYSTLDISFGVGPAHTSSSNFLPENTSLSLSFSGEPSSCAMALPKTSLE
jgi:hypothetical protein